MRRAALLFALAALAAPGVGRAQTILDQEQRLIDIHSLLLDLPPVQSPAALARGVVGLSLEVVTIPPIDGTTGTKVQITAHDRTVLYPRPRLMVGLPAPDRFRAFVGLSYIPPFEIRGVSTNYFAGEAGFGFASEDRPIRLGLRLHGVVATSRAPVTDPATRDELETRLWGADLGVGGHFRYSALDLEPYGGAGVVSLHGRFTVTSDGNVIESSYTGAAFQAGVRLLYGARWEGVAELDAYPQRLVHVNLRFGYLFGG